MKSKNITVVLGIVFLLLCGCETEASPSQPLILAIEGDAVNKAAIEEVIRTNPNILIPRSSTEYSMKIIEPDPNIKYHILRIEPDPDIEYSMIIIDPTTVVIFLFLGSSNKVLIIDITLPIEVIISITLISFCCLIVPKNFFNGVRFRT